MLGLETQQELTMQMSREEFMEKVKEVSPWAGEKIEWTTGGVTGGNCWGDSANQAVSPEDEPEDECIDEVLQAVIPDLTYLEFRKLERAGIWERDTRESYEYYGNYYTYASKKLNLDKLYEALVDITACR